MALTPVQSVSNDITVFFHRSLLSIKNVLVSCQLFFNCSFWFFEGKKIVGVGVAAKGITLINYCKIDKTVLEYLTDKSPLKIGKFCPGMHIPVVSDKKLLEDKPDYAVIFAWNFAEEIMNNLEEYKKLGGKFLIPIPTPKIV